MLAVNRVGAVGQPSTPVAVTTMPPPANITTLQAVSGEVRCVPLSWEASPEEDVIGYTLYRNTAADQGFEELAVLKGRDTTEYLDGRKNPGDLEDNSK